MWNVNLWAVLVSAVASMVIGSIWYGPLFGKKFMVAVGMDKWTPEQKAAEMKKMWVSYVLQLVASLVMFYVLAGIIAGFGHLTVGGGMMTALIMWVGFVVPIKLGEALWGGNKTLFLLGTFNMLVTLLAAGAILGAWN